MTSGKPPPTPHNRPVADTRPPGARSRRQRQLAIMRFARPRYRRIAPLMAPGTKMSVREYEQWRDAHAWDPSRGTELLIQTELAPAA